MEELTKVILERVSKLESLDYFTLSVNLLLFLLSRPMATRYSQIKDEERSRVRLRVLHFLNLALFLSYLVAVCFNVHIAKQFSQSFLVILATFLLIHFIEVFLQARYGKKLDIEGFARNVDTHTSKTLELFCAVIILVIAVVLLINLGTGELDAENQRSGFHRIVLLRHQGVLGGGFSQRHLYHWPRARDAGRRYPHSQ